MKLNDIYHTDRELERASDRAVELWRRRRWPEFEKTMPVPRRSSDTCPPCNGRCEQGRRCPAHVHSAEACTDIGADVPRPRMRLRDTLALAALMLVTWSFLLGVVLIIFG